MSASTRLVVVPTFNEAENLGPLARAVLDLGFDLLIVDDGSPDGTGDIADALASTWPGRVFVIHRAGKLGLGSAYVAGFERALSLGYRRIFQMDADFSHDPADLVRLDAALETCDLALGTRWVPGGGAERWPIWRELLSRGGSLYAGLVLDLPFRDLTGGFKGWRAHILESIPLGRIHSNGYAFQIEMTHRAIEAGASAREVPIRFRDRQRGHSKMSAGIVWEALWVVWRLRLTAPGAARPEPEPVATLADDVAPIDSRWRERLR